MKHLKGCEISKIVGECKVVVKSFGGAEVWCMKDHVKPIMLF